MLEIRHGPRSSMTERPWDGPAIRPARPPDQDAIARHYDELDPFYRALWGEHLHHGLWTTGEESPAEAALALVHEVARRAGIEPGHHVCDVGCGYGAVARVLVRSGATVTGLTVSGAQHRYAEAGDDAGVQDAQAQDARGRVRAPRFLLRDWLENRLPDEEFDAVLAIESLAHMPDSGRAVAEAFRVLRPGGRFAACVWMAAESPRRWEVRHLLRPICDEGRLPGLPAPSDYGRWLAEAGFRDADLDDVSHRVARTWAVCALRLGRAALRPAAWRYLLDGRNTERAFARTVLRLLVGYRTGAVRYGILTATKPGRP